MAFPCDVIAFDSLYSISPSIELDRIGDKPQETKGETEKTEDGLLRVPQRAKYMRFHPYLVEIDSPAPSETAVDTVDRPGLPREGG